MSNKIALFENKKIRSAWMEAAEEWYFSVVDIVEALTDSADPKQYIKKMRSRDPELNGNWGTICTPVEMIAVDGKRRKVQATDTRGITPDSINPLPPKPSHSSSGSQASARNVSKRRRILSCPSTALLKHI